MSGITPLPTPPSTTDPSNFSTRADDFLAALPTFATEANDLAAALNNISTTSTSTTSNTIGTGSKAFTVESGKSYFPGQSVTIAHTGDPTNRMFAVVDSYDSGTGALVVTSQAVEGSGTFTDWTITLGFNGVIGTAQIANGAVTVDKLSYETRGVGELFDWPHASTPSYGLLCNGAQVSRATYAALFAAIGTTWGVGDGSTTFNLPNIPEGYTTIQANANEGTSTTGEVMAHAHTFQRIVTPGGGGLINGSSFSASIDTYTTGSTGGAANKAAGVYVRKCIKF